MRLTNSKESLTLQAGYSLFPQEASSNCQEIARLIYAIQSHCFDLEDHLRVDLAYCSAVSFGRGRWIAPPRAFASFSANNTMSFIQSGLQIHTQEAETAGQ
jgi:hypothetical protein